MTAPKNSESASSLADDLFTRAVAQPDRPAILGPRADQRLRYADLAARVQELAAVLTDAGLRPSMNIGLHYPSGGAYIA